MSLAIEEYKKKVKAFSELKTSTKNIWKVSYRKLKYPGNTYTEYFKHVVAFDYAHCMKIIEVYPDHQLKNLRGVEFVCSAVEIEDIKYDNKH